MLKQRVKGNKRKHSLLLSACAIEMKELNTMITARFTGQTVYDGKLIGIMDQNRIVTIHYTYVTIYNELRSGNAAFSLDVNTSSTEYCDAYNWLGLIQRQECQYIKDELTPVLTDILRQRLS